MVSSSKVNTTSFKGAQRKRVLVAYACSVVVVALVNLRLLLREVPKGWNNYSTTAAAIPFKPLLTPEELSVPPFIKVTHAPTTRTKTVTNSSISFLVIGYWAQEGYQYFDEQASTELDNKGQERGD
jgi:hypothetical protein